MKVTKEQVLEWFDNDEINDIARYMSSNFTNWYKNPEAIKEFIDDTFGKKELLLLREHFQLKENEVRDSDPDNDPEDFSIKIGKSWLNIEVCSINALTVKDLGEDMFSKFVGNDDYVWRWL